MPAQVASARGRFKVLVVAAVPSSTLGDESQQVIDIRSTHGIRTRRRDSAPTEKSRDAPAR